MWSTLRQRKPILLATAILLTIYAFLRCGSRKLFDFAHGIFLYFPFSSRFFDTEQSLDHRSNTQGIDRRHSHQESATTDRRPEPDVDRDRAWLSLQFHDQQCTRIMRPDELSLPTTHPLVEKKEEILRRISGSIFGLAIGDALGAQVEFRPHEYLQQHPVTDFQAGGTWGLEEGQFTDDTSMALCLANSLISCRGFNLYDQLVRYKWWYRHGYMSSTGQCFDIGNATRDSIQEFERRQLQFARDNDIPDDQIDDLHTLNLLRDFDVRCSRDGVAGNGALMRLAPVPLFFFRDPPIAVEYSGLSGEVTHGDVKAIDACRYYGALIVAALQDYTKDELLDDRFYEKHVSWFGGKDLHPEILFIARGSYKKNGGYEEGIRGGGYIVKAIEAALWSFWSTTTFEEGALAAVNLGDDTDTTAAIFGQLGGAFYGHDGLPKRWEEQVYARNFLSTVSKFIAHEGDSWSSKYQSSYASDNQNETLSV